jgi:pimeloyl-ACP methyl ester carboxylesterase
MNTTDSSPLPSPFRSDAAETRYVDGPSTRFGYRRMGPGGGILLVLCMRWRGTVDHWDPKFLQVLSDEREVIVFDNAGVGSSSGSVPCSVAEMAAGVLEFVDALGLSCIDLFGWSMGGFVAQTVALTRPELIRRLIVAGSNPGKVPGAPVSQARVLDSPPKPAEDDEDFLRLFFPSTPAAREAGLASLRRIDTRLRASDVAVSEAGWRNQMQAISDWAAGHDDAWPRLQDLTMPVLVANGAHDVMTDAFNTYAMSTRLPNATIILYSDAGHAFLFQHPEKFGQQVLEFLR